MGGTEKTKDIVAIIGDIENRLIDEYEKLQKEAENNCLYAINYTERMDRLEAQNDVINEITHRLGMNCNAFQRTTIKK